ELRNKNRDAIAQQFTDSSGNVQFLNLRPDDYFVAVYSGVDPRVGPIVTGPFHVNHPYRGVTIISPQPPNGPPALMGGGSGGTVAESLIDMSAYPILTEDISTAAGATVSPASGAGGAAPLGQTVDAAIRGVLGWRPKKNDPKGFAAALTQAFNLKDVEGH